MIFSKPVALASALMAFSLSPAVAQEEPTTPGAIPDPSTYQGSQELQRQSDQQDQQYRQQQQEPAYQQPMQPYSGGQRQWTGASGISPVQLCRRRLAASPRFGPLAGKMALGPADPQAIQLFANSSRPTPSEKALILKWVEGSRHCHAIWRSSAPGPTQAQLIADSRWGLTAMLSLTHQLLAGQLTYGQFSYRRAMNQLSMDRFFAANR